MPHTENGETPIVTKEEGGLTRRGLLAGALGAAAATQLLTSGPLFAQATTNAPTTDAKSPLETWTAKPLPEKIFNTEANGLRKLTHTEHHKLYTGYVNKYNEIVTSLKVADTDPSRANQTYSPIRELKVELTFAIGGIKNHELYFDILGGDGKPTGDAADALATAYGSVEKWQQDCKATAIGARGWVWTAIDYDLGGPFNFIGDAQNTFPVWNALPFIAVDTYEHAYMLDFATGRAAYLDALFKSLDWGVINRRFAQAVRARDILSNAMAHIGTA